MFVYLYRQKTSGLGSEDESNGTKNVAQWSSGHLVSALKHFHGKSAYYLQSEW